NRISDLKSWDPTYDYETGTVAWEREDADMGARAAARLLRAREAERERDELRERLADAVVIPRDAIPDELVERLWLLDGFLSEDPNWDGSALRRYLRIAARLLSGATTEGDER